MSVIANTTVISNFASIGQLELLHQLYTTLHISTEVYGEVLDGIDEGYSFYTEVGLVLHPFSESGWIHLTSVTGHEELRLFGTMPAHLHPGEASCIAISHSRGWQFLTDDLAARRFAANLGVRVSGTLGCLVLAVEHGLCGLNQANVQSLSTAIPSYTASSAARFALPCASSGKTSRNAPRICANSARLKQ